MSELDESGRAAFLAAVGGSVGPDRLRALVAEVVGAAAWRDPTGALVAAPAGPALEASTFGEVVDRWARVDLGDRYLRYPAPGSRRGSGLHLHDPVSGALAVVTDLGEALVACPDGAAIAEALGLAAARAAWPDDTFQWTGTAVARRWRVVGEVERWPGEIQLQAARAYRPELRIGDTIWLSDRERLPACWVLDLIAGG